MPFFNNLVHRIYKLKGVTKLFYAATANRTTTKTQAKQQKNATEIPVVDLIFTKLIIILKQYHFQTQNSLLATQKCPFHGLVLFFDTIITIFVSLCTQKTSILNTQLITFLIFFLKSLAYLNFI
jgi:hypothetical protein